jgi:hypothetical protein
VSQVLVELARVDFNALQGSALLYFVNVFATALIGVGLGLRPDGVEGGLILIGRLVNVVVALAVFF